MQSIDFDHLFSSFSQLKVGVVGDVMLDTYWWGKVDRISPEAPVPIVALNNREERIGGAGNVALNLKSLVAAVHVISVIGNDADGKQLIGLLEKNGIHAGFIIKSEARITTNKIRILSRNQQMMRLDAESTIDLSEAEENHFIASFKSYLEKENPQLVILEDYNKGVLTKKVIQVVIDLCKEKNILTAVDPKRKNFFSYKKADIFKPNLHEAKEALNIIHDTVDEKFLSEVHHLLYAELQHKVSLITLSEKGVFFQKGTEKSILPTHIRTIADVSGAGDTVIAVASIVYTATKNVQLMAEMANIAGGMVCEEVGTAAIDKEKFKQECKKLLS